MFVKEVWRYPVKSMAGERLSEATIGPLGIAGDRTVLVHKRGKVVTSRTHHRLLGLKGRLNGQGVPSISGHAWNSPEALALVKAAAGPDDGIDPVRGGRAIRRAAALDRYGWRDFPYGH